MSFYPVVPWAIVNAVHPPTYPPIHPWVKKPVSWWSWPSGLCFWKAAWNFVHPLLDCYKTILADAITVDLSSCVCACVYSSARTRIYFPTQIGSFYPEELIACPINSKPLRSGTSDRWRDHSIMESVLGWMSGDRLSSSACTTNLLCDLGRLS